MPDYWNNTSGKEHAGMFQELQDSQCGYCGVLERQENRQGGVEDNNTKMENQTM